MTQEEVKIPLVIGVTGHIDITDKNLTSEKIKQFFCLLKQDFPDTPIIMISALAEGADLLFVKAGYEIYPDAKLIAALPFVKERYLQDFKNEIDDFNKYYEKAYLKLNMSETNLQFCDEDGYEQAGEYICNNANLLLAIWDGIYAKDENGNLLKGGTSDIVSKVLAGNFQNVADSSIKYPKKIPVIQIVTERNKKPANYINQFSYGDILALVNNDGENEHGTIKIENSLLKPLSGYKEFDVLKYIHQFNQVLFEKATPEKIEKSKSYLIPQNVKYPKNIETLTDIYSLCDTLAVSEQYIYKTVLFTFLVLICFTALAMDLPIISEYKFIIFAILSLVMLCWNVVFTFFRGSNKYIDARILAESLRVEIFWRLAGIKEHVSKYLLQQERGEIVWIKTTVENWLLTLPQNEDDENCNRDITYQYWLKGQADYYVKKSKWCTNTVRKTTKFKCSVALFCFTSAFIAGFMDFTISHQSIHITPVIDRFYDVFVSGFDKVFAGFGYTPETYENAAKVMSFIKSLMFVIGGFVFSLISFIESEQGWSEHSKSYTKTGNLFKNALKQYDDTDDETLKENILFDLGQAALREEESWFVLHRNTIPGKTSRVWRRYI